MDGTPRPPRAPPRSLSLTRSLPSTTPFFPCFLSSQARPSAYREMHKEAFEWMVNRLGVCDSRFVCIRVQICIFLPTVGGESTHFHPDSRKHRVPNPKSDSEGGREGRHFRRRVFTWAILNLSSIHPEQNKAALQSKIDLVGGSNPIPFPHSSHSKSPTTPPLHRGRGRWRAALQNQKCKKCQKKEEEEGKKRRGRDQRRLKLW